MAHGKLNNPVIEMCRGIKQSLLNILILELGIFRAYFFTVRIKSCQFHNASHG